MYKNDLRLASQKDTNDNFYPSLFVKKTRLILYLATITIFFTIFIKLQNQRDSIHSLFNQTVNKHYVSNRRVCKLQCQLISSV